MSALADTPDFRRDASAFVFPLFQLVLIAHAFSKIEGISYSVGKVLVGIASAPVFGARTPTAGEWKPVCGQGDSLSL